MNTPGGSIPPTNIIASIPSSPSTTRAEQPFEFSVPAIPPRLAKIGRRISQLGETFNTDEVTPSRRGSHVPDVPGMGDEPVMCPFCNKPLPPALFAGHVHLPKRTATPRVSIAEAKGDATIVTSTPVVAEKKLLDALPVSSPVVATSESFAKHVSAAESADTVAAKSVVSPEDLRRWSRLAGIPADPVASTSAKPDQPQPLLLKHNHKERSTSSTNRFGFFGRAIKSDKEEADSDDEAAGTGYNKLDAPGSPSDDEVMTDEPKMIKSETEAMAQRAEPEEGRSAADDGDAVPELGTEDMRSVLKEVLGKVNKLSQSQSTLLASHSSLLTSLKIARSNLAMAEANTENLEEQLKRARTTSRVPSGTTLATPAAVSKPATTPAQQPAAPIPTSSKPTSATTKPAVITPASRYVTSMDQPRTAIPSSVPARRSIEERARPMSLQLPPVNPLENGPESATGSDSKGVFNFWVGGKKKLPGGFGTVNIPSPAQVMEAIEGSRPGTPTGERRAAPGGGYDFRNLPPMNQQPSVVRANTAEEHLRESPGLARSMSHSALPTLATSPTVRPNSALRPATISANNSELVKIRQAYSAAQGRMDAMAKELAELKKGKVEMEAELENLSQALFEEANKMVADERRKRAEVEESLKEVREEREALRETIKVLGGKVEEQTEEDETFDAASFEPRDLDKHYEALRKTIHHVADGAEDVTDLEGLAATTISPDSMATSTVQAENIGSTTSPFLNTLSPEFSMAALSSDVKPTSYAAPPDTPAPPLDPNPWSDPPPAESGKIGLGISDTPADGEVPSPVEDLDRLMARLQADMGAK